MPNIDPETGKPIQTDTCNLPALLVGTDDTYMVQTACVPIPDAYPAPWALATVQLTIQDRLHAVEREDDGIPNDERWRLIAEWHTRAGAIAQDAEYTFSSYDAMHVFMTSDAEFLNRVGLTRDRILRLNWTDVTE